MDFALPVPVLTALERLTRAGFEAWVVGGCVRDLLLGKRPADYDLTTSARPDQTEAVFAGERIIETGLAHGTVTVLLGGMPLEITTYRVDGAYPDGRHPEQVRFTPSLTEDLARRDFTVNAMALSAGGELRDPFHGREDLSERTVRCVGEPELRFREDALRILRALRFSAALDFTLEPGTGRAMRNMAPNLALVSPERVRAELDKLICGPGAARVISEETETLATVLPELLPMRGFDQRNPHHCYDVLSHCLIAMTQLPPEPTLRWAGLLHDVGKPQCFQKDAHGVGHFYGHAARSAELADSVCRRLRMDRRSRERICVLVREHDRQIEPREVPVRRALSKLGAELFFELLALKRADNLAQAPEYRDRQAEYDKIEDIARRILADGSALRLRDLTVNGEDLAGLGVLPGPEMGRILRSLLNAVVEGVVPNEKPALLKLAREKLAREKLEKERR